MADIKQVFVCSAPRSGSTFLDMLLGGHSHVASLGEFSYLGKVLALNETCGCGSTVRDCENWALVFDRVAADKGIDLRQDPYALWQWDTRAMRVIDHQQQTRAYLLASKLRGAWLNLREKPANPIRRAMPLPPRLSQGLQHCLYLYDVLGAVWGKQILIDSSKNLFKALQVYRARPASTRIILLARDGRGVLYSRRKSGMPAAKSIDAWAKYYTRAQQVLQHVPSEAKMLVQYERLATDTEQALNELCTFLKVPYEPKMLQLESGVRHVVNGNQNTKTNRAGGIKLDEAWRNNLSQADLDYFQNVAGSLNATLGYTS